MKSSMRDYYLSDQEGNPEPHGANGAGKLSGF
jgi:hypothetical protein